METLTKIFLPLLILCGYLSSAQQISFDNLNSSNVLNMLSEMTKISDLQKSSEVRLMQYGDDNFAEIKANSKTQLSALQFGDFNYLNFDNAFQKDASKSTISTQGNNNIIDVVGSNSISDKMQIHLKGDNMTIFMRNF